MVTRIQKWGNSHYYRGSHVFVHAIKGQFAQSMAGSKGVVRSHMRGIAPGTCELVVSHRPAIRF